jgi:hypothetical protein
MVATDNSGVAGGQRATPTPISLPRQRYGSKSLTLTFNASDK